MKGQKGGPSWPLDRPMLNLPRRLGDSPTYLESCNVLLCKTSFLMNVSRKDRNIVDTRHKLLMGRIQMDQKINQRRIHSINPSATVSKLKLFVVRGATFI